MEKETSLIPRLIPLFGWSTVFSGFFGLLINQKRFLFRLLLKHLVKISKLNVLRFREVKPIFCIFHFVVVVLVGSFLVGWGW